MQNNYYHSFILLYYYYFHLSAIDMNEAHWQLTHKWHLAACSQSLLTESLISNNQWLCPIWFPCFWQERCQPSTSTSEQKWQRPHRTEETNSPWISSLNTQYLSLYFSRKRKALWLPKSSNWIKQVEPYLQTRNRECVLTGQLRKVVVIALVFQGKGWWFDSGYKGPNHSAVKNGGKSGHNFWSWGRRGSQVWYW